MPNTYNPPIRARVTQNGYITDMWRRWCIDVGALTDPSLKSYMESVPTATLHNFAAFNSDGDVFDSGKSDESYADAIHTHGEIVNRTVTEDTILTVTDFGKLIICNQPGDDINITAPSVGEDEIGSVLKIVRIGSGFCKLHAADADLIENGTAGGFIMNIETNRSAANIELVLVAAAQWAINGGLGIWLNF